MSERRASPLADYILFKERQQQVERSRGSGPDPVKQQELHDAIVSGKIDVGPKPDHSAPVEDIRPKYNGEEAWLVHKAFSNGGHIDVRDLPELRRLFDSSS